MINGDSRIYDPMISEAESFIREMEKKDEGSLYKWDKSTVKEFRDIPVEVLLEDDYFLGLKDQLYEGVKQDIIDLWYERKKREVNLALFLEAIGAGKSFKSSIILWLLWYELSMHLNPQKHFGLVNDSIIAIMLLSRSETQTRRVAYTYIRQRFSSGFNKDYFPVNPNYTREIRIDRNNTTVYPGTSSAMSALGYNVYSSVIDEANFLEVTEGSKKGQEDVYDAAQEMYHAVNNRMTSRFMRGGKLPGILVMISSPRFPDSFMERKKKEIETIGEVELKAFVRSRSLWQAKGSEYFPEFYKQSKYFIVDKDSLQIVKENA